MQVAQKWRFGVIVLVATISRILCIVAAICLLSSCNQIPEHWHSAPKLIDADGSSYVACTGMIRVYNPSRDVTSSSSPSYEIVFTDNYGQAQDLKNLKSYQVADVGHEVYYVMPSSANPDNTTTTFSNGTPMTPGNIVFFGDNGSQGRARWDGPGKWNPVPCS
jgi:hypothetical protein